MSRMIKNAFEEIKKRTILAKELSRLRVRELKISRKSLVFMFQRLFDYTLISSPSKSKMLEREINLNKREFESLLEERRTLIESFQKSNNQVIEYDRIFGKRWSR